MKISKKEAEVLEFLMQQGESTQSELASRLKIKKSNLSNYIRNLSDFGLVDIRKAGRNNRLKLSQIFFSEYNKLGNPSLERVVYRAIIGQKPYLLSYFQGKKFTIKDMLMPPATAKRTLAKLRNLGVVFMEKNGVYIIRQEMEQLSRFCRNILYAMHLEQANKTFRITSSFFVSQAPTEWAVLLVTRKTIQTKEYFPTAYNLFSRYGLRLILTERQYYTNIKPKIEEVIIHALVLSAGALPQRMLDTRGILYVCALIIKNRVGYEKLAKTKHKFGLTDESLRNILDFINSKGEKTFPGFPSWKEVEEVSHG